MNAFTETDRHNYPELTQNDLVLIIGGYVGQDAHILFEKYHPMIVCYEPVKEFFDQLTARFSKPQFQGRVLAIHAGIGATGRREMFGVKGDMSGAFCDSATRESVGILPINAELTRWIEEFGLNPALCIINAEGAEYEILEELLATGRITAFKHLQVQPHAVVPDADTRWNSIRNRLLMHFRITREDPQMGIGWILLERK